MRRDEPDDGGHHGRLSNRLGLLRLVDCFTAGDRLEPDRDRDQFRERWRVSIFRPQSEAVNSALNAASHLAVFIDLLVVLSGQDLGTNSKLRNTNRAIISLSFALPNQ